MRPSNEAVWGGNFEDLNDPIRGTRALRIRTLATLADRHTQIFFSLVARTLSCVWTKLARVSVLKSFGKIHTPDCVVKEKL